MKQYIELLNHVLKNGIETKDRTGTGTISCFDAPQMIFDLSKGFPLLTTKKMFVNGMIDELLWFISGSTNAYDLPERTQKWWTPWAKEDGELGPIYGKQLRKIDYNEFSSKPPLDQLLKIIDSIKNEPFSRRHVISLWNPTEVEDMALPTCHGSIIQFFVTPDDKGIAKYLSCKMYQRSGDVFIGVPVNIASYSLFTMMIAQVCNLEPKDFVHIIGNAHIYSNHIEQCKIQIEREPKSLSIMNICKTVKNIDLFKTSDFYLENYESWPAIKAEIAI